MKSKQFDKITIILFNTVLLRHGFTTKDSRRCNFYRKVNDDVYHFIGAYLMAGGTRYRILVFPASPVIDPLFFEQFPDDIGIPSDSWSYLSEHGVGVDQGHFNCKSKENLLNRFEKTVSNLLTDLAIPYLDQFRSVDDMISVIKHPFF